MSRGSKMETEIINTQKINKIFKDVDGIISTSPENSQERKSMEGETEGVLLATLKGFVENLKKIENNLGNKSMIRDSVKGLKFDIEFLEKKLKEKREL